MDASGWCSCLTTVVAYLEHITDKLVIDLVAVGAFDVNGTSVMIPQRVTLERHGIVAEASGDTGPTAVYHRGSDRFEESISKASQEHREGLLRLLVWARGLKCRKFATLETSEGIGGRRFVLRPIPRGESSCLVAIWNEGGSYLSFHRSVFERKAPAFIERVETLVGFSLGHGNWIQDISDELLQVLTEAYEEAAK